MFNNALQPTGHSSKQRVYYEDKFGRRIDFGLDHILSRVALCAKNEDGILKLQRAVNNFYDHSVLKEDNVFGSKTATTAFDIMRDHGYEELLSRMD